jgi:hypothetical protein
MIGGCLLRQEVVHLDSTALKDLSAIQQKSVPSVIAALKDQVTPLNATPVSIKIQQGKQAASHVLLGITAQQMSCAMVLVHPNHSHALHVTIAHLARKDRTITRVQPVLSAMQHISCVRISVRIALLVNIVQTKP